MHAADGNFDSQANLDESSESTTDRSCGTPLTEQAHSRDEGRSSHSRRSECPCVSQISHYTPVSPNINAHTVLVVAICKQNNPVATLT